MEEDEQRLSEAQQAAEDEAALRAMREEGMLSDQPTSSQPQLGKPGHAITPPSPLKCCGWNSQGGSGPPQAFLSQNCLTWVVFSFLFFSFLFFSCLFLPFLFLPFLAFSCLFLPFLAFSCLVLSPTPQVKQIKQSAGMSNPINRQPDQIDRRKMSHTENSNYHMTCAFAMCMDQPE